MPIKNQQTKLVLNSFYFVLNKNLAHVFSKHQKQAAVQVFRQTKSESVVAFSTKNTTYRDAKCSIDQNLRKISPNPQKCSGVYRIKLLCENDWIFVNTVDACYIVEQCKCRDRYKCVSIHYQTFHSASFYGLTRKPSKP